MWSVLLMGLAGVLVGPERSAHPLRAVLPGGPGLRPLIGRYQSLRFGVARRRDELRASAGAAPRRALGHLAALLIQPLVR